MYKLSFEIPCPYNDIINYRVFTDKLLRKVIHSECGRLTTYNIYSVLYSSKNTIIIEQTISQSTIPLYGYFTNFDLQTLLLNIQELTPVVLGLFKHAKYYTINMEMFRLPKPIEYRNIVTAEEYQWK